MKRETIQTKGFILRYLTAISIILLLLCQLGCEEGVSRQGGGADDDLLIIEIPEDQPVRYQMTSERKVELKFTGDEKSKKQPPQNMTEKLNATVAYQVIDANPYGLSTVKATIEEISVRRDNFSSRNSGSDPTMQLKGKSYTFKISPNGTLSDLDEFQAIVESIGATAIQDRGQSGKVKVPDMLWDFIALQWTLFEPVSTLPNPSSGVRKGQTWDAHQLVPLPMPIPIVRDTTFTLEDFEMDPDTGNRIAVIQSIYTKSEENASVIENVFKPYKGSYQLQGMFGFLRKYKFEELSGSGTTRFNMDTGTLLSKDHSYRLGATASFMLPLGSTVPVLTFDQTFTVRKVQP